jgi:3-deoxy-D-manno-octulosonate 8-phosphate phosphatase (KDO 8-P phosphatase)
MVRNPIPAFPSVLRRRLLRPRLRRIRLVVSDVDGVLTDGGLSSDEAGKVLKRFDVRDGLAVRMLQQAGITLALLSGGRGGASEQRALHLDIHHCRVGVGDKRAAPEELRQELAIGREQTAFLGDDLNDLVVREATGLLITPADGAPGLRRQADWILRRQADWILRRRGGDGALLEFRDALLGSQGWMEEFETAGVGTTN